MAAEDAESRAMRRALVDKLQRDGHVHSPRVAAAIEAVAREIFVPGVPLEEVYRSSEAIVTKRLDGVGVSSASAPDVVALMLEQLDPRPGDSVLEIGAGTGYNAALLAHLVGDTGRVVTLDIDEDLVVGAREHLRAAGYSRVEVVLGDGALGYPDERAYDRIILTVASSDIAPAWREQLAQPYGRLVMPLGLRGLQRCVAFKPAQAASPVQQAQSPDDCLVSDRLRSCSFIPLRGVLAAGSLRVPLDPEGALVLARPDEPLPLATDTIAALLRAPARIWPSGVVTTFEDVREGLHLWLVAHQTGVCSVWGEASVQGLPDLFGLPDRVRGTLCVMDSTGLALLAWDDETARAGELCVLAPDGAEALAETLTRLLDDWNAAGRPMDADVEIRAYPRGHDTPSDPDAVAIDQRWTRFVLRWRPHGL